MYMRSICLFSCKYDDWDSHVVCYDVWCDDVSATIITLGVSVSASTEFWCWEFFRVLPCSYGSGRHCGVVGSFVSDSCLPSRMNPSLILVDSICRRSRRQSGSVDRGEEVMNRISDKRLPKDEHTMYEYRDVSWTTWWINNWFVRSEWRNGSVVGP